MYIVTVSSGLGVRSIRPKIKVWFSKILVCRMEWYFPPGRTNSLYSHLGAFPAKTYLTKCWRIMMKLRGEKLNYKSVAKEIWKPPFFGSWSPVGTESLPCLFDSRFLWMFRTTPIFGMSRDHNRKCLKTRTEWIVFEIQQYILPKHGIIYNL